MCDERNHYDQGIFVKSMKISYEVSILDIVILVDYISGLNPEGFLQENAEMGKLDENLYKNFDFLFFIIHLEQFTSLEFLP